MTLIIKAVLTLRYTPPGHEGKGEIPHTPPGHEGKGEIPHTPPGHEGKGEIPQAQRDSCG